ncbi:MAG: biotin--[Clostridia bacterium]|nr:biotin--[acetyl-CoA-carboxylase] ligase [Clostridia bacterium]
MDLKTNIEKYLNFNCNITCVDKTGSTNLDAKSAAQNGADEFTVILANHQTNGRGRLGRTFFSPQGSGIYLSIVLRPKFSNENNLFITVAAAVAVCDAIKNITGIKTGIKWVNDVYLGNKKICGILTESALSSDSQTPQFSVLGIGLNLYKPQSDFPADIKDIAGSLFENETNNEIKAKLTAQIINNFKKYYDNLLNKEYLQKYRELSVILGKEIYFLKNDNKIFGTAQEIDDNAHLIVKEKSGVTHVLGAGEVSVRF